MSAVGSGGVIERRGLQPAGGYGPTHGAVPIRSTTDVNTFQDVLTQRLTQQKVRLSAHAGERLRHAGVEVDARFEERLQAAVNKAAAKGSRSSLVLLDKMALVVSVQNRTVITAVDSARMKDNVFTNIDSAVIS